MMDPESEVVQGFKPVMPTYQGVLTQADAAAIVEFIKLLRFEKPAPKVELPAVQAISPAVTNEPIAPSPAGEPANGSDNRRPRSFERRTTVGSQRTAP
jgi:hypothetical protein